VEQMMKMVLKYARRAVCRSFLILIVGVRDLAERRVGKVSRNKC